ncbi:MbcA/ParS/Xre antitoxin family protein [Billgrantia sp. Q4P2]|uniref:MbcA/ParS/Xre antitoxin family protein n=1 Tax=Billgrantia sp. Q4P2 TaxID=3463857 RepID=UPI004055FED1
MPCRNAGSRLNTTTTSDKRGSGKWILGIYKALQILLPRADAADSWLRRPNRNPLFAGQPPLERLRTGLVQDLYFVRQSCRPHGRAGTSAMSGTVREFAMSSSCYWWSEG